MIEGGKRNFRRGLEKKELLGSCASTDGFEELIHHDRCGAICLGHPAGRESMLDRIAGDGLEGGRSAGFIVKGEQPFAVRIKIGPTGILQNHGTPQGEISRAAVAEPAAAGKDVAVFRHAEFAAAVGDVVPVTPPGRIERLGFDDAPATLEEQLLGGVVGREVGGDFEFLLGPTRKIDELGELFRFIAVPATVVFDLGIAVPMGKGRPCVAGLFREGVREVIKDDGDPDREPGLSGEPRPRFG